MPCLLAVVLWCVPSLGLCSSPSLLTPSLTCQVWWVCGRRLRAPSERPAGCWGRRANWRWSELWDPKPQPPTPPFNSSSLTGIHSTCHNQPGLCAQVNTLRHAGEQSANTHVHRREVTEYISCWTGQVRVSAETFYFPSSKFPYKFFSRKYWMFHFTVELKQVVYLQEYIF